MAREVQVLAWCDVDMAEDRRVPMAASHEVVLDGKAYTVDLCEDHEAAAWKPFAALVAHGSAPAPKGAQNRAQRAQVTRGANTQAPTTTGTKLGRPLSNPAKALPVGVRCLVVGCGQAMDGRTQGALTQHMGSHHQVSLEDLGRICPVCGEVKAPGGGLSAHVQHAHPEVSTPALQGVLAAWWWASGHGDPEGAIAATGLLPFLPPLAPGATRVQVHTP